MNIDHHIKELLQQHECVIIPDFGGFLIQTTPANYHKSRLEFLPPSTIINFHSHLRKNDGLLIQSIMSDENLNYESAAKIVVDYTNQCKQQLKESKSIIVKGVGKIYVDAENKVQFKSTEGLNYNTNSFGLPILSAKKINQVAVTEEKVTQELKKRKISPLAASFTVAASLIALVMASALFFMHNGNEGQQEFVRANLAEVVLPVKNWANNQPKEQKAETNLFKAKTNQDLDESVEKTTANQESVEFSLDDYTPMGKDVTSTSLANDTDYHVIIGMFNTQENAQARYQNALRLGYSHTKVKKGRKYYRVMVPFSNEIITKKDAVHELRMNIEPEAWIWETLYRNNYNR